MQRRTLITTAAAALLLKQTLVADDMPVLGEFGHLRGRLVYDGDPPKPAAIFVKGGAIGPLIDESLLVNADNKGIANVAIYLRLKRGEKLPPIHPEYEMHAMRSDGPRKRVLFVAANRFEPHMLLLRTDEELIVKNANVDGSAPMIDAIAGPPMAFVLPAGGDKKVGFMFEERLPIRVTCAVHPWMSSRLMVKDHPYMAATDADGRFEICNLPAGEREFQFWHERAGYVTRLKRDGVETAWQRGCAELTIPSDETLDLGDIEISPKLFEH